jgi:hypothetical protein
VDTMSLSRPWSVLTLLLAFSSCPKHVSVTGVPCAANSDGLIATCDEACDCSACASLWARKGCAWQTDRCLSGGDADAGITEPSQCSGPRAEASHANH